jgi:hypothetical protein
MLGRGRPFSPASRQNQGEFRRRCPVCRGTALRRGPPVSKLAIGFPLRRPNANENGPRAPPPSVEATC